MGRFKTFEFLTYEGIGPTRFLAFEALFRKKPTLFASLIRNLLN